MHCQGSLVVSPLLAHVWLQEHAVITAALGLKPGEGGGLGRTFTPEANILQELQLVEERIAGRSCALWLGLGRQGVGAKRGGSQKGS